MNNEGVDKSKRQFLTTALTVVGAVGTGYLAVPFLAQMQPSVKAMAAGAPVEVDISKMEAGQLIRVAWRGKPVWIPTTLRATRRSSVRPSPLRFSACACSAYRRPRRAERRSSPRLSAFLKIAWPYQKVGAKPVRPRRPICTRWPKRSSTDSPTEPATSAIPPLSLCPSTISSLRSTTASWPQEYEPMGSSRTIPTGRQPIVWRIRHETAAPQIFRWLTGRAMRSP